MFVINLNKCLSFLHLIRKNDENIMINIVHSRNDFYLSEFCCIPNSCNVMKTYPFSTPGWYTTFLPIFI